MNKRVFSLVIAAVLMFSSLAFAGCRREVCDTCNCTYGYECICTGCNGCGNENGESELIAYRLSAIGVLEDFVGAKVQTLYTQENWELIQSLFEQGKEKIEQAESKESIRNALATSKSAIKDIPQRDLTANDFSLTVSVSSEAIQLGQNIQGTATFKNLSGRKIEIAHSQSWIRPFIAVWYDFEGLIDFNQTSIEPEGTISLNFQRGYRLPIGTHALIVTASFDLLVIESHQIIGTIPLVIEAKEIILTVV